MGFKGVPGHEFVGIVEQAPSPYWVGRRVVGEINCVCHACHYCLMELPRHCLNRSVLGIQNRNGAFAEYLTLPEENLHAAPGSVRDDVLVFTEPVAAAFRITEQVTVNASDRVVVLGDGKLGQLAAQVLWLYSKNLVCVGKHEWKLELLQKLGIATARAEDPIERGVDLVIEATGSHAGLARALELVRPEGTVVLKTTVAHPTAIELAGPVVNEVRILGSRCGPFRPALEALSMGNVEVRPMISESYALADGVDALRRAQVPGVMKVLIHM
jgi:threonine dehydrogenase-like Zn-dependent dehydrogenase